MKTKVLAALTIAGALVFGATISANAKTDAYVVKDNSKNVIYEFSKQELINSFMNYKINGTDPLYNEYNKVFSAYGLYAFHDDTNKYVDYIEVRDAFMEAKINNVPFVLDTFTETKGTNMTSIPQIIKEVVASGSGLTYEDKDTGSTGETEYLEVISIE